MSLALGIGVNAQPFAYVAAGAGYTVSVLNTSNNSVAGSISVPGPGGLAVTPDGAYVYATSATVNLVSVIGTATNSVVATIDVGAPQVQLAFSPNGAQAYAVDQVANQVAVISMASKSLVANIPVGNRPYAVAFSPDGRRAFVTNSWSNTVSVIDTASRTVIDTFSTPFGPSGVVVSPNGSLLYIANAYANTVTVHSAASGNIVATVPGLNYPSWLAMTPNGSRVYAANTNGASVSVIDTNSNSLISTVGVGNSPTWIAMSPDGTRAYVTNQYSFTLSVIDTGSSSVVNTISGVGLYPNAVAMIPAAASAPPPSAAPVTPIVPSPPLTVSAMSAPWAISTTHAGNFKQSQSGAAYTITLTNTGSLATVGTVTITETAPNGLALVSIAGAGWACSANTCTRNDGVGAGTSYPAITATVNVAANAPSQVNNTVTLSAGGATLASASDMTTIAPTAHVTAPLFGLIDTPADGITGVTGAIGVTGWALSNAGIANVAFWREAIAGEAAPANGLISVGNATNVPGARPDVAITYPGYPNNTAGWGAQILTNMLPNSNGTPGWGNGTYRIHAIATNSAGQSVDLGVRSITADNAHATHPFGTIDTPGQGATVSGSSYINFGWALTPSPGNVIPKDGSTMWVFIDNQAVGHPVYNNYRSDIATLFPGLQNSNGGIGYYIIDTTKLTNGLHSIAWSVTDNAGNVGGLGSRLFVVRN